MIFLIMFYYVLNTSTIIETMSVCYPIDIYLLKVNNINTRIRCEICSKSTIKTLEQRHWRRSGVFIVNFDMLLLLTLSR